MPVATTLAKLRAEISDALGDLLVATPSQSSAGSLTFASFAGVYPDDYFRGAEVYRDGVGTATITDFDGTAGVATVNPALNFGTGEVAIGNLNGRGWRKAEIDRAINAAIREVADQNFVRVGDESLTLAVGTYEYDLPADWTHLSTVEVKDLAAFEHYRVLHPRHWRLAPGRKLKLRAEVVDCLYPDRPLRLWGWKGVVELAADADETEVAADYIVAFALARLYGQKAGGSQTDPDLRRQSARDWLALAEQKKAKARTIFPPNTRRVIA